MYPRYTHCIMYLVPSRENHSCVKPCILKRINLSMWETINLFALYLVRKDKGTQCNLIYENPFMGNLGESYSSAMSYSTFETK